MKRGLKINSEVTVRIIAGGESSRFKSELPKHLQELGGEILIQRTIRLFEKYTTNVEIIIPNDIDEQANAQIYLSHLADYKTFYRQHKVQGRSSKFIEALEIGADKKSILIVYGDVVFSNQAVEEIMSNLNTQNVRFFGRIEDAPFVIKGGGEMFAIFIPINEVKNFGNCIKVTQELFNNKKIWRDSGWQIMQIYSGEIPSRSGHERPKKTRYFYELSGITDDLDFIEDYHKFLAQFPNNQRALFDIYLDTVDDIHKIKKILNLGWDTIKPEHFDRKVEGEEVFWLPKTRASKILLDLIIEKEIKYKDSIKISLLKDFNYTKIGVNVKHFEQSHFLKKCWRLIPESIRYWIAKKILR